LRYVICHHSVIKYYLTITDVLMLLYGKQNQQVTHRQYRRPQSDPKLSFVSKCHITKLFIIHVIL
jgi:hypothetical protein